PQLPFWYYVQMDREGQLSVPSVCFPVIPRCFLSPYADDRVEFTLCGVEELDRYMALEPLRFTSFEDYIGYIHELFTQLAGSTLPDFQVDGFVCVKDGIVLMPDEETGAAAGIIGLYEYLLKQDTLPPLLMTLASLQPVKPIEPVSTGELIRWNEKHLGQMGFEFPLSVSQRKSLYTFLSDENRIFAVNGPPGTGKTTLLQSIVANAMVRSVLEGDGERPEVILACSANNQAVTNIIESFSRSKTRPGSGLEGRWIPDVEGYATYLPASSKREEELKGINYKKINGEGLFQQLETKEYLRNAREQFLDHAAAYFRRPALSLAEYTKKLKTQIRQIAQILTEGGKAWKEYLSAKDLVRVHGLQEGSTPMDAAAFEKEIKLLREAQQTVLTYFQRESLFRQFLCWLNVKRAWKERKAELDVLLDEYPLQGMVIQTYTSSAILMQITERVRLLQTVVEKIQRWTHWKTGNQIKGEPPLSEEAYWEKEYQKIAIRNEQGKEVSMNCFYDELDITLRHKAFQLATHYWEGKWIAATEEALQEENFTSKGAEPSKKRWERHAMLTPCFVSTFYMTPRFFTSFRYMGKDERDKTVFDKEPLLDFIDLLIVDEAGQVPPEVGAATFALAKQAVVVGDIKQIEPVWSTTPKVDLGNLLEAGLIHQYDDLVYEKEYSPKGFLSSDGSIMKMA
ncbi:MAG: AAA family ATPase, partial [Tannerellaceae bacterium]|nr:AAA family ATPase [Tannerellaceae bacterium]